MRTSKGIALFAVVVVWVLMASSAMAGDPGKDVNIINTKSNPVPITGNIGITGTANVNLMNTENNPLPISVVRERIPFTISSYCYVHSGNTACAITDDLNVPSGMRAIILFVQCHAEAIQQAPETRAICMVQDLTAALPGGPSEGLRSVPTLSLSPTPDQFGIASLSTNVLFTGKYYATGRIYVHPPDALITSSPLRFTLSGYFEPK